MAKSNKSAQHQGIFRRMLRDKRGKIGLTLVLFMVSLAVFAPWIAPYDPTLQMFSPLQQPNPVNPFGTDDLGRDLLSRVIFGTRISVSVSVLGVGMGATIGTLLGLIAAQRGGWLGAGIMRGAEVIQAFPGIILAIAIVAVIGPGTLQIAFAIGVNAIPLFVRVTNGAIQKEMQLDYVAATVSLGASPMRVAIRHLLPNGLPFVLPLLSVRLGTGVLAESALSFLGFGAQRPTPTWGGLLAESGAFLTIMPWQSVFPGVAIVLLVIGFTLLGDAVQNVIDPKSRPRRLVAMGDPARVSLSDK